MKKESIIWYEKYNELEIHHANVESSTWVSEVLRIWGGQSGFENKREEGILGIGGCGSGKRDGKYSQRGRHIK